MTAIVYVHIILLNEEKFERHSYLCLSIMASSRDMVLLQHTTIMNDGRNESNFVTVDVKSKSAVGGGLTSEDVALALDSREFHSSHLDLPIGGTATFSFHDIHYSVKLKREKETKTILNGISGYKVCYS